MQCKAAGSAKGGVLTFVKSGINFKPRNDLKLYKSKELESFIDVIHPKETDSTDDLCHIFTNDVCHIFTNDVCHIFTNDVCHIFTNDVCHIFTNDMCHIFTNDVSYIH